MKELTALQWAKDGYVLTSEAKGIEKWTNRSHTRKAVYYKENEVREDKDAAKTLLKTKRNEHRESAKEREQRYNNAMAIRDKMKTEFQWLQEGRIPNDKADWKHGKNLNETYNVCAYGSNYYYCHIDDTHIPKNRDELQRAINNYNNKFKV